VWLRPPIASLRPDVKILIKYPCEFESFKEAWIITRQTPRDAGDQQEGTRCLEAAAEHLDPEERVWHRSSSGELILKRYTSIRASIVAWTIDDPQPRPYKYIQIHRTTTTHAKQPRAHTHHTHHTHTDTPSASRNICCGPSSNSFNIELLLFCIFSFFIFFTQRM